MPASVYDNNLRVIKQRWPELYTKIAALTPTIDTIQEVLVEGQITTLTVNGIHLTSSYDRVAEAELQLQSVPAHADEIHIYGFALGDQLEIALQKFTSRIIVHVLNLSVFNSVLHYIDVTELFSNSRLDIQYGDIEKTVLMPFAVSPACLQLADNKCFQIRDQLQIALASDYIKERFNAQSEVWLAQIEENIPLIKSDLDVGEIFETQKGGVAVVVAAGPSLAKSYDKIKVLKQKGAVIIAVDAILKPLLDSGIEPDFLVTLDGQRDKLLPFFDHESLSRLDTTHLVYFPVVHHDVLVQWPGSRYCAYSDLDIYTQISQQYPRAKLFVSGTVTHPAVDLAVQMGCREIYFAGLDFGYPGNRSHVSGSYYAEEVKQQSYEKSILNGYGKEIRSIQNLIVYLRDLERYIELHPEVKFYNLSRDGAKIDGVDYLAE